MTPITDSPTTKRPTKPKELATLEEYRLKLHQALTAYASSLQQKSAQADSDGLASRRDTLAGWAQAAKRAAVAIEKLDSSIAWKSAYNAPERVSDLVRLLAGEERLTDEYGTASDPIPYFVAAVRAKE